MSPGEFVGLKEALEAGCAQQQEHFEADDAAFYKELSRRLNGVSNGDE
jgi:hypothetical protein